MTATVDTSAQAEGEPRRGARVGTALLLLALTIVGVRPLIEETVDTAAQPLAAVLSELAPTRPTVTLWIDLVIIALFGATVVLRLLGRLSPRPTGLTAGTAVVALAALGSCVLASNHRLAISATLDWLTLPLLAVSLSQLTRQRWHLRLGLVVILASGCANAAECLDQHFVMHGETVAHYERIREALWSSRNIPLDDYQVELYERRVYDPAANGFFAFSNVAGSYLLLALAAAAALLVSAGSPRARLLLAGCGVLLAAGLLLTRSRGAALAGCVGVAGGLTWYLLGPRVARRPWRAWLAGWAIVAAGLAMVAGYGLARGHLPGGSLTYRWWYLEASTRMVAAHPVVGVGSGQFGRHYPRYKEIKSPEEVANPHNFLAHAAAEWGLAGLGGVLLMLLGASQVLAGVRAPPPHTALRNDPAPSVRTAVALILTLGLVIFGLRVLIVGHTDTNYVVGSNLFPALAWVAAALIGVLSIHGPLDRVVVLLGAGLAAFLVHNLITFGLFVPGSATTCFAILGLSIAAVPPAAPQAPARTRAPEPRPQAATVAAGLVALVVLAVYVAAVRPVSRSWQHLQRARALAAWDPAAAAEHFVEAARVDPRDPAPLAELAGLATPREFADAAALAEQLIRRDPESPSTYRRVATMYMQYNTLEAAVAAARACQAVLRRYPTNPEDHLRAAEAQARVQQLGGGDAALRRALQALQEAVRLDALRDSREVRRFTAARLQALRARRHEWQQRLQNRS